mgnify:FL=1
MSGMGGRLKSRTFVSRLYVFPMQLIVVELEVEKMQNFPSSRKEESTFALMENFLFPLLHYQLEFIFFYRDVEIVKVKYFQKLRQLHK